MSSGEFMTGEQRCARFGRVVLAGVDGPEWSPVLDALACDGFVVDGAGEGAVGLCGFDVGTDDEAVIGQRLMSLRRRCSVVALVGVGIEDCPAWPARMAAIGRGLDSDGALAVFAVALGVARDGDLAASGVPELLAWVVEESDAAAVAESARRGAAERLAGLRVGSAAVRSWAGSRIHAGFRELASSAHGAAAVLRTGDADGFAGWVPAASADLEARLVAAVAEQAAHLRATALVGIEGYQRRADPSSSPTAPPPTPVWQRRRWGAEDAVLVLIGASTGLGVGRLAAGSMAGWVPPWGALIVAALIGVGVAVVAVALRRRVLLRNQARAWATEVLGDARARTEWRVAAMLNGVEPTAAARVRRAASR